MLQLSHLPPSAIFEHSESLHAIILPPLASFLAHLTSPVHLRTLHEILEKYRTPDSYHRIDVRQIGSSEIPMDPELEDPLPSVADDGGEPVILPPGQTKEGYREEQAGREAARRLALEHPESLPAPDAAPLPATFKASGEATPVHGPPPVDPTPASDIASQDTQDDPLPPLPPLRRVRELRLDLRTLDAAALFALETWRRAELGLEKLDMEVPQSIWYQPPTPPPAPIVKRKPGRPRKSAPAASRDGTVASTSIPPAGAITHGSRQSSIAIGDPDPREGSPSLAATLRSQERPPEDYGPGAAGPSRPPTRSPSPDEIRPDAYNETEALDPSFIPGASPAPSSIAPSALEPDGQPRPKRGRPSKAEIAARTTFLADGTPVIAPRPKAPKNKKPRASAPPGIGAWGGAAPLHLQPFSGEGSGVTSTPSTDPAREAPSTQRHDGAPRRPVEGQQGSMQAAPLDLPPLQSPSQSRFTIPTDRGEQLAPDGSIIPSSAPPPPPAIPTPPPSVPKKRGRPPKVRPSLDPFGAIPPAPPTTTAAAAAALAPASLGAGQDIFPMTATAAPLPLPILQRAATLQEALSSSSTSSLSAALATYGDPVEKREIANLASRVVADIGTLPASPTFTPGGNRGRTGRMEMSVEITTAATPTGKAKGKKRKSLAGSEENTPRIGKRLNMTKEYKEYADEWAFLKGL